MHILPQSLLVPHSATTRALLSSQYQLELSPRQSHDRRGDNDTCSFILHRWQGTALTYTAGSNREICAWLMLFHPPTATAAATPRRKITSAASYPPF